EAYANENTFQAFLNYNLPYTVSKDDNELNFDPHQAGTSAQAKMNNMMAAWDTTWDAYPTYTQYVDKMNYYATTYPNLCTLESIGTTQSGRELLVLKISDNVTTNEGEPEFFYTSSMHGDELVGFPLMMRLIDYLLTNHGSDTEVDNLVNNLEIYINPLANPDGAYRLGNTNQITSPRRANDSNIDLNRNYPDNVAGLHDDGFDYELETLAFINFAQSKNFLVSANLHGGIELVNYPNDNAYSSQYQHSDADWFEYTGVEYATNAQNNSPAGYMIADEDAATTPSPGVTHGADWYRVYGGRQDYMNYYCQSKEITLELSDIKWVSGANLPAHWDYNKQAFLDFMKQATYGIQGTVTDQSGNPIVAKIEIAGHDVRNNFRMSEDGFGEYQKLIKAGTYNVTYSAAGYVSQTISVSVSDNAKTTQNVTLVAITSNPTVTDMDICDSGSVTLNASGTGTLNWYDAVDSKTPIASNTTSYTTPTLISTTSYFVESVVSKSNVGNTSNNTNGNIFTSSNRYLVFDCTESVKLNQVTVNSGGAGEIEVELQNSTGEALETAIVFVDAGINIINLDFTIPVANDLRLVGKNFSTGGLFRNNSGVSYPYSNGSISIKSSNAGTGFYYFFYDWKIESIKSARKQVSVNVIPSPTTNFTHVVNPTNNGEVTFTNTTVNGGTYSWDFDDLANGTSTDENPVYTFDQSGTYNVELVSDNNNCIDSKIIPVTVTVSTLSTDDEVFENSISIFPNPFQNQITITKPNANQISYKLYDLNGRLLISKQKVNTNNGRIEIENLHQLSNGTYFLKIKDLVTNKLATKKLIK
ncbi:MAG: M14 family zinc carboxypeptidase, partial [Olleya sp.]